MIPATLSPHASALFRLSGAALLLAAAVSLAACDGVPKQTNSNTTSDQGSISQDLIRMDADVRIAAANKRIDELERQVGELQSTPEKLNLDLLTNRVTQLEVNANNVVSQSDMPLTKDLTAASPTTSHDVRPNESARQPTKRASALNLPELESRSRLATPAEAKAFSSKK